MLHLAVSTKLDAVDGAHDVVVESQEQKKFRRTSTSLLLISSDCRQAFDARALALRNTARRNYFIFTLRGHGCNEIAKSIVANAAYEGIDMRAVRVDLSSTVAEVFVAADASSLSSSSFVEARFRVGGVGGGGGGRWGRLPATKCVV